MRAPPVVVCGVVAGLLLCCSAARVAWAGPPFLTDDPEPVDLHHWEVYISSLQQRDPGGLTGTLPHIEMNYGGAPNLQLHMILPCSFAPATGEGMALGLGDTELGVKYRFVEEAHGWPMIGVFPLLEVPTGSAARGLGTGDLQVLVPVWIQRSWGPWTTYGGGGYHINPGPGNQNCWYGGWELQRDFGKHLTLGGELFRTAPTVVGGHNTLVYNLGGQVNFDDGHHLLFSAGHGMQGDTGFLGYLGYQWTFGPPEKEPAEASPGH